MSIALSDSPFHHANCTRLQEPKLWYGIGILYDRYGSLEHAEEAFSQVMRMDPRFEKANEIYFRLGIIYKQQQKFSQSLEVCDGAHQYTFRKLCANNTQCFKYIVNDPPRPLSEEDIWFQIGHVHEQQKDYDAAKSAYMRVLDRDPAHAKVLQQLGWLHHQQSTSFSSQEQAIEYLEKSVNSGKPVVVQCHDSHPSNIAQTRPTHKAGTFSVAVTCHNRSTPRPMKPISKQSIVTVEIRRSGAQSECCTTRSTNTGTRLTHTRVPFVLTLTFPRCGTTWVHW